MHVEAGFYLGELFSGLHTLKKYREPIATLHEDEGFAVDTVNALQYYSVSSRKGSLLALHRISLALLHAPPPAKQLVQYAL